MSDLNPNTRESVSNIPYWQGYPEDVGGCPGKARIECGESQSGFPERKAQQVHVWIASVTKKDNGKLTVKLSTNGFAKCGTARDEDDNIISSPRFPVGCYHPSWNNGGVDNEITSDLSVYIRAYERVRNDKGRSELRVWQNITESIPSTSTPENGIVHHTFEYTPIATPTLNKASTVTMFVIGTRMHKSSCDWTWHGGQYVSGHWNSNNCDGLSRRTEVSP